MAQCKCLLVWAKQFIRQPTAAVAEPRGQYVNMHVDDIFHILVYKLHYAQLSMMIHLFLTELHGWHGGASPRYIHTRTENQMRREREREREKQA